MENKKGYLKFSRASLVDFKSGFARQKSERDYAKSVT